MNIVKSYMLNRSISGHPVGTVVYQCNRCDYGLASQDTRMTGVQHQSVTLKSDGDYPSFTCPTAALSEVFFNIEHSIPDDGVLAHYVVVDNEDGSARLKLFKNAEAKKAYIDKLEENDGRDPLDDGSITKAEIANAMTLEDVLAED